MANRNEAENALLSAFGGSSNSDGSAESSLLSTFGASSGQPSLASLIGEDQARLIQAGQKVGNYGTQAAALGLKNTSGSSPLGFLQGALRYTQRPQQAVLGLLESLLGVSQGSALQNIQAGLSGQSEFRGSDLVGAGEGGFLQKAARSAAGFGVDVFTDPLTYLTLGRGGTVRGAKALPAAEASAREAATAVLKPAMTPEVVAKPAVGLGTSTENALLGAQERSSLLTNTPMTRLGQGQPDFSLSRPVVTPQEAIAKAPVVETPSFKATVAGAEPFPGANEALAIPAIPTKLNQPTDPFIEELAKAAGKGIMTGGGRGYRKGIEEVLGTRYTPEESARLTQEIIAKTPGEIRGGVGVRIPFVGKDAEGNITLDKSAMATRRVADLTPGGGYTTDALGLGSMADQAREVFNNFRSTNFYNGYSKALNGEFGKEYADAIRNAHKNEGGYTYEMLTKNMKDATARTRSLAVRDKAASLALEAAGKMASKSDDEKRTLDAAERYFQMADDMKLEPNATQADIIGFEIASALRNHGENMFKELQAAAEAAGVSVGDLRALADNYIPRPITAQEAAYRAKYGKVKGLYNSTKGRILGFDTDETGRLVNASNTDLNARFANGEIRPVGHKTFETDPVKIAAQQFASYSEMISKLNLIADLKATGGLVAGKVGTTKLLNLPAAVKKADLAQGKISEIAGRLGYELEQATNAGDLAKVDRINVALNKLAEDHNAITALLSNVNDTDPESLKVVGNLVNILKSALATGEKEGEFLTKLEKDRLFSRRGMVTQRQSLSSVRDSIAAGLLPVGASPSEFRMPRGLDNLYADESVKYAVEKYFAVDKGLKLSPFFNNVYQPYYTLFKQYATVGRPGGYHIRNLTGGWWNNYLGDVNAADHNFSAKVQEASMRAEDSAGAGIKNAMAGKPTGLTGDADRIAKGIAQLAKSRGSDVVDYEQAQLANYILLDKLSAIKVGNHSLSDIYIAASEQNIFKSNQRLERMRSDARMEGRELADSLLNPNTTNLFRGRTTAELTDLQKKVNALANLKYLQVSGDAADLSENYIRMAAFISGAKKFGISDGGTAASLFTKALQFDYADLSPFERDVLKNIIPFYTWSRHNVPLQFNALLSQPGKFNKISNAQNELQIQFGSQGDSGDMANVVPEWMRDKFGFIAGSSMGNPLVLGINTPASDLNTFLAFGSGKAGVGKVTQQIISSANPLAKAVIEGVSGVNTFTQTPYSQNGTASPLPVDLSGFGIGFKGPNGENLVDAKTFGIIKNIIPGLDTVLKLTGRTGEPDRLLTNYLSAIGGLTASTLTPAQGAAELNNRASTLITSVERAANALGVDRDWLDAMVSNGATVQEIRDQIAQGYGRRAPQ